MLRIALHTLLLAEVVYEHMPYLRILLALIPRLLLRLIGVMIFLWGIVDQVVQSR